MLSEALDVPVTVLFTHFGDQWIRGSETLLLDLVKHLDPAHIRPVMWCNGTEMAQACQDLGLIVHRTEFAFYLDDGSPRSNPRHFMALVREASAITRRYDCRVLHANSLAPTQWLLPAARATRRPLLSHLHIDYLRRSRYVLLLHQADLIVGVSRQVLDEPLADGIPLARTQVIYNGIDFERLDKHSGIDLRGKLAIPPGTGVIGSGGSLIRRKGHDILIRALGHIQSDTPSHLIIAGDGPERQALEQLASDLGLATRVHFIGHVEPVTDLYRSCDIVALASRADAFGLVLAEAGYHSLPAVVTRVGGLPEVVLDNETGLLVPPEDPVALAGALARLIADPALRSRLGTAARMRAETRFSVQRMAFEFETTYARLASLPQTKLGWASVPGRARPLGRLLMAKKTG